MSAKLNSVFIDGGLFPQPPRVTPAGDSTDWGSYPTFGDFPSASLRDGDLAVDEETTTLYRWSEADEDWLIQLALWDGSTVGQRISDLPASAVDGALARVGTRGFVFSGSWSEMVPSFSVATFSALPASPPSGLICRVTGESGITSFVCRYSSGTWYCTSVACAWASLPTNGTWYSSGGVTVSTETSAIARLTDSGSVVDGAAVWSGSAWSFAGGFQFANVTGAQVDNTTLLAATLSADQLTLITNP